MANGWFRCILLAFTDSEPNAQMTPILPDTIKQFLCGRDIKLNPPATEEQIALLDSRVRGEVHPYIISIYRCFDGFTDRDFDAKSMIEIWPIKRVLSSEDLFVKAGYMPFSDCFGDAEIFLQSFNNPEKPVVALFEGTEMASSTYEFWEKLLSGVFDF